MHRIDQGRSHHRGSLLTAAGAGLAIFAGMVLIAIPGIRRLHQENARKICIETLVMIDIAKEKHALKHQLKPGAAITFADLQDDADLPTTHPVCVAGGRYDVMPYGQAPTCTIQGHVMPFPEKYVGP